MQNNEIIALRRIMEADRLRKAIFGADSPFYVAYSGGKDSDVIRLLLEKSGVPYELYHNHTTIDAPETVQYIRSILNIKIEYPDLSMWDLIVKTGYPPTRLARYCCRILKERGGAGRFVVTGVRWAERPQLLTVKKQLARKGQVSVQINQKRVIIKSYCYAIFKNN